MSNLLLVDASNIVMRCALGGQVEPEIAVSSATSQISRFANELRADHMILLLDVPDCPSWRKKIYPEYKAHRPINTAEWIQLAGERFAPRWLTLAQPEYEADDLIATLAHRVFKRNEACAEYTKIMILSSDSDLLPLDSIAQIWRPVNGGNITPFNRSDFLTKNGFCPSIYPDFKGMTGESSDNLPGVPGIGPKRASKLLEQYDSLENVIKAGGKEDANKDARKVFEHADDARLSKKLATLAYNAPIVQLNLSQCRI